MRWSASITPALSRRIFPSTARSVSRPVPVQRLQPSAAQGAAEPLPRDAPGDLLVALKAALDGPVEAPSVPDAPKLDDLPPASLDIEVMQERYPLLRNAL